jgi:hypothetical protein
MAEATREEGMSYHGAIFGETGSGKTYLASHKLARAFRAAGVGVLAHVPEGHHWEAASRVYHDGEKFIPVVNASRRCAVFVEMSDAVVSRHDEDFTRLATWSRNLGHRCFFIAQRHTQINPTIRDQCGMLWLFRVGRKTASILAEEYVDDALLQASELPDYHYIFKQRGQPATIHQP